MVGAGYLRVHSRPHNEVGIATLAAFERESRIVEFRDAVI